MTYRGFDQFGAMKGELLGWMRKKQPPPYSGKNYRGKTPPTADLITLGRGRARRDTVATETIVVPLNADTVVVNRTECVTGKGSACPFILKEVSSVVVACVKRCRQSEISNGGLKF